MCECVCELLFKFRRDSKFEELLNIDYNDKLYMKLVIDNLKLLICKEDKEIFERNVRSEDNMNIYAQYLYKKCKMFVTKEHFHFNKSKLYLKMKKNAIGKMTCSQSTLQFATDTKITISENNFDDMLANIPNCVRIICNLPRYCEKDTQKYKDAINQVKFIMEDFKEIGFTTEIIIEFMDEFVKVMIK